MPKKNNRNNALEGEDYTIIKITPFKDGMKQVIHSERLQISVMVMTVLEMASGDQNPIRPFPRASKIKTGSTRAEHIPLMIREFGGCLNRATPA